MRNAVIGAAAAMTGTAWTPEARAGRRRRKRRQPKTGCHALPGSGCREEVQGPGDDVLDEFYKVGPGPSSSHTIGPMRITYDFYQRCTKLPADQFAKATGLKVHLFGSLAPPARGTAPSAPRWPACWARSRPPSIRCSSTR